jgi:hypothetical protein
VPQAWLSGARPVSRRRVARIEADDDHVEVLTRLERYHAECARYAVHHLRAEHQALKVREREHDRLAAKRVVQPHLSTALVLEGCVQREALVEPLLERDLFQLFGRHGRHHPRSLLEAGEETWLLRVHDGNAQCTNQHDKGPTHFYYLLRSIIRPALESDGSRSSGAVPCAPSCGRDGSPRSTTSRIASEIGMYTVRTLRSTQP